MTITSYENLNAEAPASYNGATINRPMVDIKVQPYEKFCLSMAMFTALQNSVWMTYRIDLLFDGLQQFTYTGVKQQGINSNGWITPGQSHGDPFPSLLYVPSQIYSGAADMPPGNDTGASLVKVAAEPSLIVPNPAVLCPDCIVWKHSSVNLSSTNFGLNGAFPVMCIGYPVYIKLRINTIRVTLISLGGGATSASSGSTVCQLVYKEV